MNSYGLWIATEINEHYDCDDSRSSFIKVAFGRQVAAEKPLVLWDLNPCNPQHRIYTDYIDNYLKNYIGGYQYQHFTIDDNLSITPQRKAEIKSQYVVGSIWYRRDILGERCIAEGLVYPRYEETICKPFQANFADYVLSVDYGTQNATAVLLWGLYENTWYCIREYYYSGRDTGRQKTDEEYADDIEKTFADVIQFKENQGEYIRIIVDPSAASFIAALKRRKKYKVKPADNDVVDGIRDTDTAMYSGKIKIFDTCKCLIGELQGYCWIPDAVEDTPVKENDHACVTGETLVMTENGEKAISELVGTSGKVWSYNIETQQAELKPYNYCYLTEKQAVIFEITTNFGHKLKGTYNHPILTEKGWLKLGESWLENIALLDGSYETITDIRISGYADVYNMEVQDNHNFAVNGGIIIHNCDSMRYFVKTMKIVKRKED